MKSVIEWHSVEDRLPDGKDVLVCGYTSESERIVYQDSYMFYRLDGDCPGFVVSEMSEIEVTHWAYMPQPPEESEGVNG